jgi:hypothetical protein
MRNTRGITFGIFLALILAVIPTNAYSAQKIVVGGHCKKLNEKILYLKKTYTCVKSGKKFVWDNGIAKPFSGKSPRIPNSFSELTTDLRGISYGAWLKSQNKTSSSNSILGKLNVLVGPNTDANNLLGKDGPGSLKERRTGMELASKLYSSFKQVKNINVIYYSFADVAWAQQEYDLICSGSNSCNNPKIASTSCPSPSPCWGGSASLNANGDGILLLTIGDQGTYYQGGSLEAHEYSHTIQLSQYMFTKSCCSVPGWLSEGGAEWTQIASVFNRDYATYMKERYKGFAFGDYYSNRNPYSIEWLKDFFSLSPEKNWNQYGGKTYQIGFLATEVLVSLKGPSSLMNLFVSMGNGQNFETAFKNEFGMSWSEAVPFLSTAISGQLQKNIIS